MGRAKVAAVLWICGWNNLYMDLLLLATANLQTQCMWLQTWVHHLGLAWNFKRRLVFKAIFFNPDPNPDGSAVYDIISSLRHQGLVAWPPTERLAERKAKKTFRRHR